MTLCVTRCIFCGATNLTWEHVFPRWSHRFMLPRATGRVSSLRSTEYTDRKVSKVVRVPWQVRDWQIRCVCGGTHLTCNGGWMKSIEDAARPIMKPLILGHEVRLNQNAQAILATWAILKLMISEYDEGAKVTVHHMHRKYIKAHQRPPEKGWGVWIGHYERVRWKPEWISQPLLIISEENLRKRSSRDATYFNSNATVQVIGKLFIHVIHSPMPNMIERWRNIVPHGGTVFRIWPFTT
jgi:hypothetical protein